MSKGQGYEVVYTWPDGREEVRYGRPITDMRLAIQVLEKIRRARFQGYECPYSIRRCQD